MGCERAALIVLGSVLLTLLLAVPATWRARRDPEQSPPPPTAPSPPPPPPPPPPSWRRRLTGGERRQSPSRAVRDLRRPHGWARMARRRGRLYCQVGIGFHLQLRPSGKISGTHRANSFSEYGPTLLHAQALSRAAWTLGFPTDLNLARTAGVLEIFSVARGVVGIWGVSSRRFLAMNRKGKLYATSSFTDECLFAESFQENGHNTYASERYGAAAGSGGEGAWLVALNKLGRARRGTSPRVRRQHASTHFLPRLRRVAAAGERGFRVVSSSPRRVPPVQAETRAGAASEHGQIETPGGSRGKEVAKYLPRFRFG
uniref:Fibroblast growth factor 5-like n=1 Tax=Petromyzon marinus TaxID=7757 RepID=A0AAJ7SUX2_PETMA|nr:fibroblast growth factor 5-like [Petromyzon marinus]